MYLYAEQSARSIRYQLMATDSILTLRFQLYGFSVVVFESALTLHGPCYSKVSLRENSITSTDFLEQAYH